MYKKIIKVKLSPKLNSTEVVNFVLKNMSIINSIEINNLNFSIGKKLINTVPELPPGTIAANILKRAQNYTRSGLS
jgi:DNA modification methylase